METMYRKVVVSAIEKYKWYLRDCENGYYDMFYCKNIQNKTVSGIGIINNEIDNDLEFEKHYFISDFFELKEVPYTETQQQKDKEELLEILEKAKEMLYVPQTPSSQHTVIYDEIEFLIQKHKQ